MRRPGLACLCRVCQCGSRAALSACLGFPMQMETKPVITSPSGLGIRSAQATGHQSQRRTSFPINPTSLPPPPPPMPAAPSPGSSAAGLGPPHSPHLPASPALMYWVPAQASLAHRQWPRTSCGFSTCEQAIQVGAESGFSSEQMGQQWWFGAGGGRGARTSATGGVAG